MPLKIKNPEVEKLADEVARLAAGSFLRFLESEVWPRVPEKSLEDPHRPRRAGSAPGLWPGESVIDSSATSGAKLDSSGTDLEAA